MQPQTTLWVNKIVYRYTQLTNDLSCLKILFAKSKTNYRLYVWAPGLRQENSAKIYSLTFSSCLKCYPGADYRSEVSNIRSNSDFTTTYIWAENMEDVKLYMVELQPLKKTEQKKIR